MTENASMEKKTTPHVIEKLKRFRDKNIGANVPVVLTIANKGSRNGTDGLKMLSKQ